MARAGSFGGAGINPFGTGDLGGFSQYDVGASIDADNAAKDNRAALEAYRIAVAWANGEASDEEYLASLQKQLSATSDEQTRLSLQNKIHDTQETIGRSRAKAAGLDAQIAYEQGLLSRTDPGNYKYGQVRDALDSLLAQRRRRDYSNLQSRYDDGQLSTEALRGWVAGMLGGLSPDAPDYSDWINVLDSIEEQLENEADAEVDQRYENEEITDDEYLALLVERRDRYSPESPKWDARNRDVEDFQRRLNEHRQNEADAANLDAWQHGKISDEDRLAYLKGRLDATDPKDEDRAALQQAYSDAAFSLAEDQLTYDVQHNKKPVGDLVAFYKTYQATLNPGSKLWRDVQNRIESLDGWQSSSGGGGRSGGGSGAGAGTKDNPSGIPTTKVVVNPKTAASAWTKMVYTGAMASGATTKKAPRRQGGDIVQYMLQQAQEAEERGFKYTVVWDPNRPNDTTLALDPFTGQPEVDPKTGKPTGRKVPGSGYVTMDEMVVPSLLTAKALWQRTVADNMQAHGETGWIDAMRLADVAEDEADKSYANTFKVDGVTVSQWQKELKKVPERVKAAEVRGDYAGMAWMMMRADRMADSLVGPKSEIAWALDQDTKDSILEGTQGLSQMTQLRALDWGGYAFDEQSGQMVAVGTTVSYIDSLTGEIVSNVPLQFAMKQKGFVGARSVVIDAKIKNTFFLNLDAGSGHDGKNEPTWALKERAGFEGTKEGGWVKVTTDMNGKPVEGWTKLKDAPAGMDPIVSIRLEDGTSFNVRASQLGGAVDVKYISFPVSGGQSMSAFSIDGTRWAYSAPGSATPRLVAADQLVFKAVPIPEQPGTVGYYALDENGVASDEPVFVRGTDGVIVRGSAPVKAGAWNGTVTWAGTGETQGVKRQWSVTQKRWVNVFNPGAVWDTEMGATITTGFVDTDANGAVNLFANPDAFYTMVHGYDPETGYMSGGRADQRYRELSVVQRKEADPFDAVYPVAARGRKGEPGTVGRLAREQQDAEERRRQAYLPPALTSGDPRLQRQVAGFTGRVPYRTETGYGWGSLVNGKQPLVGWARVPARVATQTMGMVNPEAEPVLPRRKAGPAVPPGLGKPTFTVVPGYPAGMPKTEPEKKPIAGPKPKPNLKAQKAATARLAGLAATAKKKAGPPAPKPKPTKPKPTKVVNKPIAS